MRLGNEEVRRELRESFQHGFQLEQERAGVLEDIAKRQRQLWKIDEQIAANEARKSILMDNMSGDRYRSVIVAPTPVSRRSVDSESPHHQPPVTLEDQSRYGEDQTPEPYPRTKRQPTTKQSDELEDAANAVVTQSDVRKSRNRFLHETRYPTVVLLDNQWTEI